MKNKFIAALVCLVLGAFLVLGVSRADAQTGDVCVPSPETSETIVVSEAVPAVPGTPAIPAVTEEQRTGWQRYSWTGGPWESDTAPAFPSDDWQPNVQGDPHGIGVEGAYFVSHGNSGKGDWFYLEGIYETVVIAPEVPATPGTPAVPEVTKTVVTPAVVCDPPVVTETPVTPETPSDTTEGEVTSVPEVTVVEEDPVVTTVTKNEPNKTVKIQTHESGEVTRTVKHYPEDRKEEGL